MNHLHNLVFSRLQEAVQPNRVIARLISQKLAAFGVVLNNEQLAKIEGDIDIEKLDQITIDFTDEQVRQLQASQPKSLENLSLEFTEQDTAGIENRIQRSIETLIPQVITLGADSLLAAWKSAAVELLPKQRTERSQFEQTVYQTWGRAIDLLETLVSICMEAGSDFSKHIHSETTEEDALLIGVITRLHVRACQVSFEKLTLLKSGFADGALARWRTLHEIVVTAMFIAMHGKDTAERYLAHTAITDYHEAASYQKHYQTLGFEAIPQEELDKLKSERDRLRRLFGNDFDSDNGWASNALSIPTPKFTDIEQHVSLEHLRPFYKLANINVHAGAKGAVFRLGLPNPKSNLLVAGPSIFGLTDPGQNMAISMNQITATLLLLKPNLDRLALLTATQKLIGEIQAAFVQAQESLEAKAAG